MFLSQETQKSDTHTCMRVHKGTGKFQAEEWKECHANNHHDYLMQLYQY